MKKLIMFAPLCLLFFAPDLLKAAGAVKKTETVYIQTSAVCEECKERIESAVRELKGIRKAVLNLEDDRLMVEYVSGKITPEKIRETISNAGYDADDVKANITVYQSLPMCCKKSGEKH